MKISEESITERTSAFLVFFVMLQPTIFQHIIAINYLFLVLQTIVFCLLIVLRIVNRSDRGEEVVESYSTITTLLILYYTYLTIITLYKHGNVSSVVSQALHFISFVMYLEAVMRYNPQELFHSCLGILEFYVVINLLTIILFPKGLYSTDYFDNNFVLGYDNQNINFILPAMIIVLLKHKYYEPCLGELIFIYMISIMTAFCIWSAMTIVLTISIAALALILCKQSNCDTQNFFPHGRYINVRLLLFINIAVFILLVFYNFRYYLSGLGIWLGKSIDTMSGRMNIWNSVIRYIIKNPIIGYGKEKVAERALKMGFSVRHVAGLHAHNRYLETMYRGGVILEGIYFCMLFVTSKRLYANRYTNSSMILSIGLFIYLMGMLTEFYDYCLFLWGFMIIGQYCQEFDYIRLNSIQ